MRPSRLAVSVVCLCAVVAPAVLHAQPVVSDDFNGCGLDPLWTVVDPIGDGVVSITGVGSGQVELQLHVPTGTKHDPYGTNQALRVVQAIGDDDFLIEARFDSAVTTGYQIQGLVVEQDANDFLRLDVYHNGASTRIFAATFVNGAATIRANQTIAAGAPIYLAIDRAGDTWNLAYSYDGAAWTTAAGFTHAMTVQAVGPFAGNAGTNPAFTARVDYFFDALAPVVPEDDPGALGPPATLSTSVVGAGSVTVDPNQVAYYCDETVTVTAVPAAGHEFAGWSGDLAGSNTSAPLQMTTDRSVTATFTPLGALAIENVDVVPGLDTATISWDTNKPADSEVAYGRTAGYELGTVSDAGLVTSHAVELSGLLPDTEYYFEVRSSDGAESDAVGGLSFVTLPPPPGAGIVSDAFNACELDTGLWSAIDPVGDADITLTGVGSAHARLAITVPGGSGHDVWTSGNFAPRAMQAVTDADFNLEVKFDSLPAGQYAMQGVIVEADAQSFVRFDFFSTGTQTRIFAATFAGGSASVKHNAAITPGNGPLWMGITRAGNLWTQSWSTDGVNWTPAASFTHALAVTAVGPFVGNAGNNPPAFTGLVDYFFDVYTPVSPEDGPLPDPPSTLTLDVGPHGAVLTDPNASEYYCDELVMLTAVPDPGYVLTAWGGDLSGSDPQQTLDMSTSRSVSATFGQDPTPLELSNVELLPGDTGITVRWTTSKPATSEVAYGTSPAYELGTVTDGAYVLEHELAVTGLSPETLYHLQITSVDGLGAGISSADQTATTTPLGGFGSDDFNAFNLGPDWTFIDPVGDATLAFTGTNSPDAHLEITLPAGSAHDVWTSGNDAARVMRAAADVDFGLEVKFESLITERYQMQGVIVEQDADNFLRFDFYSDGNSCRVFAAAFSGGSAAVKVNTTLSCGFPWYMRVIRLGDSWEQQYSFNGTNWTTATTFTHALTVNAVGPFAANAGSNAPGFTAVVDYFFNTANPIDPEDGAVVEDTYPPSISNLETSAGEDQIVVSWETDEPATALIEYGETPTYELGSVSESGYLIDHLHQIGGLQPDTDHYLRISCEDASGNLAQTELVVRTGAVGSSTGPVIDVWYGDHQVFGQVGLPQPWINILGNVSDSEGVAALSYTLNGGAPRGLNIGPDNRRLAAPGDFNIDMDVLDLDAGLNQVVITASDTLGNDTIRVVTVELHVGPIWPLPDTVAWDQLSAVTDRSQIIDGKWDLAPGGVRPLELGYDRLVGIGDIEWTDYEVVVPVTVHFVDTENAYTPQSGDPLIGVILRWPGHTPSAHTQPHWRFYPLGAIGWYRWGETGVNRLQIFGNNGVILDNDSTQTLSTGTEYVFKMRVESVGSVDQYKLKVWPAAAAEPTDWVLSGQQGGATDPASGCLVLVAHHVDATFGDVTVNPGPFSDAEPLALNGIQAAVGGDQAVISWQTNLPADSRVDYGLTTAYELGSVSDPTETTSHAITLVGLDPETTYHYRVTSETADETAQSGNLTMTTGPPGQQPGEADIVSDDFNAATLGGHWTFVDPRGDSSYQLTGSGSGDAHLEISVPAGTPHDLWSSGNEAARMMQAVSDTDFSATVRFDSKPTARYQIQGLLAEQSPGNYVRFDTVSDGSKTRVFAASFVNNAPTVRISKVVTLQASTWLRVERSGATWTLSWSSDGVTFAEAGSFTHDLTVTQVGPFAGNAAGGTSPAFTARVDYFFNDASPITPEDGTP